jgi:polysaccharide pyruvyl transferase WcaK-like protein
LNKGKKNQVVLTYAWGTPNAGDHALTLGAIELLIRHLPQDKITVISRFSSQDDPKDPTTDIKLRYPEVEVLGSPFKFSRRTAIARLLEKVYGLLVLFFVSFFPRISTKLFKRNDAIQSIANAKIVLCNGGNLFYWNEHRRSLPRLLALSLPFILAKKLGVPYAFLPQTMGPIDNNILLGYTKSLLESAKFVLFRDDNSLKYMSNLLNANKTKIELVPDLAFVVSDDYKNLDQNVIEALDNCGLDIDDKFIAVTLRASKLGDPEGVTGKSVDNNAIEMVTSYIKDVLIPVAEKRGLNILVVEQTTVDDETSHHFQKITQENFSGKVAYISNRDPLFLSALYLRSECLVGMRLHSLIFALRVGKPAFAIYLKQFGPKTPGIYSSFGLGEYCVDIEELSSSTCSSKLDEMLENYTSVENKLSNKLLIALKKEHEFISKYIQ